MTSTRRPALPSSKSENIIAVLSLTGIACYLVLQYALNIDHDSYTLNLNVSLASTASSLFQGNLTFLMASEELPLLAVLLLGGIPLVFQLVEKTLKGNFGADLLAGLSIVTAVCLQEYLAGSLVVLMLSGGAVLECYAVRKASSVL